MVPLAGASPEFTHKEGKAIIQVASLFNQLLQHFPRMEFGALVKENNAERCAKGFACWTQLVSMLFCQLAHADSLREICNGLGCCLGKLVHLGITKAPINPRFPMPTNTGLPSCTRICFIRHCRDSATKEAWGRARRSSVSRTSCCHSTRPLFRCAWSCSRGPSFAEPKAASRRTFCWTTTTTCRVTC